MKKRSAILIGLLASGLVAAVTCAVFIFSNSGSSAASATAGNDNVAKIAVAKTNTQFPALPHPQDAPADPYAPTPIVQIAEIDIPKIGVQEPVYEGVTLTVLNHGPGHWPGTAGPGQLGNMVIAGHRVTHSHPFRNIDQLVAGDDIIVKANNKSYTYKVTQTLVVKPQDTFIVNQRPGFEITLFACHPPGSATYRYVVKGELAN